MGDSPLLISPHLIPPSSSDPFLHGANLDEEAFPFLLFSPSFFTVVGMSSCPLSAMLPPLMNGEVKQEQWDEVRYLDLRVRYQAIG